MKLRISGLLAIATALTVVASLAPRSGSAASPALETLYSFCAQTGGVYDCADGADPAAGLIMDAAGNLYSTTLQGGADGAGTVFELTPNATKTSWTETVLHSFGSQSGDGLGAYAGLIMDSAGNLYGTTSGGINGSTGAYIGGTVFELTPNAAKTSWAETVLYGFCASGASCTDGQFPYAGLIMDATGNLYSTTNSGGADGGGTVFELIPNAAKTTWTETVLYSFCASGASCTDGAGPYAGLIMDPAGNLYGTTNSGGANGGGTVFQLTPNASKTKWMETVLYSFCASGASCTDGASPYAGLIMDAAGNLYGTTPQGGAHGGYGTVFELTPNAAKAKWAETVLYSFCAQGGENCTDGLGPLAGVIMDAAGNLYGTTSGAILGSTGAYIGGTVFELAPNMAKTKWAETVLYSFCAQSGCTDGQSPDAGLIVDAAGELYGTTYYGGAHAGLFIPPIGGGTVFALTGSGFVTPVILPSSEVATRASGLAYSRVSQTFNGTVTITNISGGAISGPFQILLTGLTAGVTLVNATGDFSGSPYLTIPAIASLASGQSATVSVKFGNPSYARINFMPVIYSGSI